MHIFDVVAACVACLVLVALIAILARQRQMLRTTASLPLAVQRGNRWVYGIARYSGGELQWFRALGVGTHPSRVLRQGGVEVLTRRAPRPDERKSLPGSVVVIDCRADGEPVSLAIGESAYTGFISWLESSAPRS